MSATLLPILQRLYLFEGVDPVLVARIAASSQLEKFEANTVVFSEGAASNGKAYVILGGRVRVTIGTEIVAELEPGSVFGEYALIREESRSATVRSLGNLTCLILEEATLFDLLDQSDALGEILMKRIMENSKKGLGIFGED